MRVGAFFGLLSGAINWLGELGLPRLGSAPERDIVRGSPSDSEVLREALDMLPQGVVLLDPDGRYIFWNRRYADIYSGSADLFEVGVRLEDTLRVGIARGEYPEASGSEEAWLGERMARMRNPAGKIEQKLADGRWILIDERRTSDGGFIGLRVDITDIKAREQSFRLLFDANPVPMFVVSAADERILAVNDAALNHYGFGRATMMGALFNMIEWPGAAAAPEPDRSDEAAQSWTSRHRTASEDAIDVTLFSRPLDYAGESARLIAAFDVTDRNRAEAKAAYLAHHDQLTGLANRAYLHLRLRELFGRGAVAPSVAILLIDLDRFKLINDTHGHFGGDKLLREAAQRIRGALSEQDFVARLGGDEFAVVTGITDVDDLGRLADALIEALSTSYRLDDHEASIGASIGIAIGPNDGGDPERLMRCADLALYRAKAEGRGAYHYFEAAMDARLQDRRSMEVDLAAALDKSELQVFYQPLVALRTGEISAFGALAPSDPGRRPALGVHSDRRGDGPDLQGRDLCAGARLRGRREMAGADQDRGQSVAAAISLRRVARRRPDGAAPIGTAGVPARIGDNRSDAAGAHRTGAVDAPRAACARGANFDGRFRDGLFVPQLSPQLSLRQDQDRPILRSGNGDERGCRGDRPDDRQSRREPGDPGDGGRHRDRRSRSIARRTRVHGRTRLLLQPAAPAHGGRRARRPRWIQGRTGPMLRRGGLDSLSRSPRRRCDARPARLAKASLRA
jgi:diguanylate cyclase (GGDEF)-like protein/PAS domain S-box-containing protein